MSFKTLALLATLSAAALAKQRYPSSFSVTSRSTLFGLVERQGEECEAQCGASCMPADASCCSEDLGAFCTAGNVCNLDTTCCPVGDTCDGTTGGCVIEEYVLCGEGMICLPFLSSTDRLADAL